jgi:nicotinamidase-related amidase
MHTALLVIDVQRGLCEGEYAAFEAGPLVSRINAVAKKARAAQVPVMWIHHEETQGPLQHGSAGWQLAPGLETDTHDILLRKTTSDSFLRTGLERLLKVHKVETLVVCGLQTEYCVDTTVRRALGLGYPVVLVSDAHSTLDNGVLTAAQIIAHHNATLSSMDSFGPRVQLVPASQVSFEAEAPAE